MIVSLLFFVSCGLRVLNYLKTRFLLPNAAISDGTEQCDNDESLEFPLAVDGSCYYTPDGEIRFAPQVFTQRYMAVAQEIECLGEFKKVIEFGCNKFGFFPFLKHITFVEHIIFVDLNRNLLNEKCKLVNPLTSDFLRNRESPLDIDVFCGNAAIPDGRLSDANAVIAIELIEHMYPEDLNNLPQCIFGVIQPELAIFTTPNKDFNIVFPDPLALRDPDHKFEWSRKQFHDWCHNIALRYNNYKLTLKGIGRGPDTHYQYGACSQMAVFQREGPSRPTDSVQFQENAYELIHSVKYPFSQKVELDIQEIISIEARRYFSYKRNSDEFNDQEFINVPLVDVARFVSSHTQDIDLIRHVLQDNGYLIENTDTKGEVVLLSFEETSSSSSSADSYIEYVNEDSTSEHVLQSENYEQEYWDDSNSSDNEQVKNIFIDEGAFQASTPLVNGKNSLFQRACNAGNQESELDLQSSNLPSIQVNFFMESRSDDHPSNGIVASTRSENQSCDAVPSENFKSCRSSERVKSLVSILENKCESSKSFDAKSESNDRTQKLVHCSESKITNSPIVKQDGSETRGNAEFNGGSREHEFGHSIASDTAESNSTLIPAVLPDFRCAISSLVEDEGISNGSRMLKNDNASIKLTEKHSMESTSTSPALKCDNVNLPYSSDGSETVTLNYKSGFLEISEIICDISNVRNHVCSQNPSSEPSQSVPSVNTSLSIGSCTDNTAAFSSAQESNYHMAFPSVCVNSSNNLCYSQNVVSSPVPGNSPTLCSPNHGISCNQNEAPSSSNKCTILICEDNPSSHVLCDNFKMMSSPLTGRNIVTQLDLISSDILVSGSNLPLKSNIEFPVSPILDSQKMSSSKVVTVSHSDNFVLPSKEGDSSKYKVNDIIPMTVGETPKISVEEKVIYRDAHSSLDGDSYNRLSIDLGESSKVQDEAKIVTEDIDDSGKCKSIKVGCEFKDQVHENGIGLGGPVMQQCGMPSEEKASSCLKLNINGNYEVANFMDKGVSDKNGCISLCAQENKDTDVKIKEPLPMNVNNLNSFSNGKCTLDLQLSLKEFPVKMMKEREIDQVSAMNRCKSLQLIRDNVEKRSNRFSLCCDKDGFEKDDSSKLFGMGCSLEEFGSCWREETEVFNVDDSRSQSRAADSGYPNTSERDPDMDTDLTPEQVDEILSENDSSFDEHDEEDDDDHVIPEIPEIIIPGAAPPVHIIEHVENGDVANNNQDGEGNNMDGEDIIEFQHLIQDNAADGNDQPPNDPAPPPVVHQESDSEDENRYVSASESVTDETTIVDDETRDYPEVSFYKENPWDLTPGNHSDWHFTDKSKTIWAPPSGWSPVPVASSNLSDSHQWDKVLNSPTGTQIQDSPNELTKPSCSKTDNGKWKSGPNGSFQSNHSKLIAEDKPVIADDSAGIKTSKPDILFKNSTNDQSGHSSQNVIGKYHSKIYDCTWSSNPSISSGGSDGLTSFSNGDSLSDAVKESCTGNRFMYNLINKQAGNKEGTSNGTGDSDVHSSNSKINDASYILAGLLPCSRIDSDIPPQFSKSCSSSDVLLFDRDSIEYSCIASIGENNAVNRGTLLADSSSTPVMGWTDAAMSSLSLIAHASSSGSLLTDSSNWTLEFEQYNDFPSWLLNVLADDTVSTFAMGDAVPTVPDEAILPGLEVSEFSLINQPPPEVSSNVHGDMMGGGEPQFHP